MKKKRILYPALLLFSLMCYGCGSIKNAKLQEFTTSPYFEEQILRFEYQPDVSIEINAPSASSFNPGNPTAIIFYALPNGNTTDWTIGKKESTGDDWHYFIQHIGAQTRYVRSIDPSINYVTVYLEAKQRSWGLWRRENSGSNEIIKNIVELVIEIFSDYDPYVVLSGHSGGGNFIFGFMEAVSDMPDYVRRVSFLDSNYNWDPEKYGKKLIDWLDRSSGNHLSVIAYNDSIALYNGKPIVSATGGTWYRSRVMQRYLEENTSMKWIKNTDGDRGVLKYSADKGKIEFLLKENPGREIFHTVIVERNGFIQSLFSGTKLTGKGYEFYGDPVYTDFIQTDTIYPHLLKIPPRSADAVGGVEFMSKILDMPLEEREELIFQEISGGNIPEFMRDVVWIRERLADAEGVEHDVEFYVLPDFLSIGSDKDFCRIPMIPGTAQRIADHFGAVLPTPQISDMIYRHAVVRMNPHPMTPDQTMVTIPVFTEHNRIIEEQRIEYGHPLNSLIVGHKKDIVVTNLFTKRPNAVIIYGWHYPDGKAIQPPHAGHHGKYVDYSHGVRLISGEILIDGVNMKTGDVLAHPVLYRLLSSEQLIRWRY